MSKKESIKNTFNRISDSLFALRIALDPRGFLNDLRVMFGLQGEKFQKVDSTVMYNLLDMNFLCTQKSIDNGTITQAMVNNDRDLLARGRTWLKNEEDKMDKMTVRSYKSWFHSYDGSIGKAQRAVNKGSPVKPVRMSKPKPARPEVQVSVPKPSFR